MMRSALALAIVSVALTLGLLAQQAEPALADYNLTGQWQISIGGGAPCPATITQQHTPTPSKFYSLTVFLTCSSSTSVFNGTIHGRPEHLARRRSLPRCCGDGRDGVCGQPHHHWDILRRAGQRFVQHIHARALRHRRRWAAKADPESDSGTVCRLNVFNWDRYKRRYCRRLPTRTGPTNCVVGVGTTFTLKAYVDSLPDAVAGYTGFDLLVSVVGVEWNGQADADVWPDCQAESIAPFVYQAVEWGCVVTSGASTYTGVIGTAQFRCQADGSLTLRHGPDSTSNTYLRNEFLTFFESGPDALTIDCAGALPTVTPTPPPVGGLATDAPSDHSSTHAWWAAVIASGRSAHWSGVHR